jgi:hypothetical protein
VQTMSGQGQGVANIRCVWPPVGSAGTLVSHQVAEICLLPYPTHKYVLRPAISKLQTILTAQCRLGSSLVTLLFCRI